MMENNKSQLKIQTKNSNKSQLTVEYYNDFCIVYIFIFVDIDVNI